MNKVSLVFKKRVFCFFFFLIKKPNPFPRGQSGCERVKAGPKCPCKVTP